MKLLDQNRESYVGYIRVLWPHLDIYIAHKKMQGGGGQTYHG